MTNQYVRIYLEGKAAFPHELNCPYAGDLRLARFWRLGWHRARDESRGAPSERETLQKLADEMASELPPDLREWLEL